MSYRITKPSRFSALLRTEHGFTAAEKTLALVVALGLILGMTKIILGGASQGALTAKATLEGQSVNAPASDPSGTPPTVAVAEQTGTGGSSQSVDGNHASSNGGGGFWSSLAHGVLGIASLVPGLNIPASLIDAGLYTVEGDYLNAGISMVGVIPIAGQGVKAVKMGKMVIKTVDGANDIRKGVKGVWATIDVTKAEIKIAQKTSRASKKPIWTSTKKPTPKTPVENAFSHWKKHGQEFPQYKNAKQYVDGAHDFMKNPPPGTLSKTRANGEKVFYDPKSNTFAVQTAEGTPKTMFKPDSATHGHKTNLDYFYAQ